MENLTQYEGKEHFENLVLDIPGKPPCMLDRDLAKIYGVSTKRLNEARERNPRKFTEGVDYFQLTKSEVAICDLKLDTGHLPVHAPSGALRHLDLAAERAHRGLPLGQRDEHALDHRRGRPAIDDDHSVARQPLPERGRTIDEHHARRQRSQHPIHELVRPRPGLPP